MLTVTKTKPLAPKHERWFASNVQDSTHPSRLFFGTVTFLSVLWLSGTLWLSSMNTIVGSPDEAANELFMQHLAESGQYRISTHVSVAVLKYIHPRSMMTTGQTLAPVSFLGFVQVGALVIRVFGAGAERGLNPILAFIGLFALYRIFRRFWTRWWSLLGVALLAVHPAFFSYATIPYLHNGSFVFTLMIAAWCMLRLLERPKSFSAIVAGAVFGIAILFRPIEGLWLVPAALLLVAARRLWRELIIFGAATIVIQLPWLLADQAVYGSLLSTGYSIGESIDDSIGPSSVFTPLAKVLTPVGGHWSWHWLSSVWWYFILFLPTWSVMSFVALGRYFQRKYSTISKAVKLSVLSLIGIFPLVYYGTWNLYQNTPASVNGALASYVRYWLPLYVLMTPGVVIVLRLIQRRWLVLLVEIILAGSQIITIWSQPVAGLRSRLQANKKYSQQRAFVLGATPPQAIIIAGPSDKYFQDQRVSAFRLPQTETDWQALQALVAQWPVYLLVQPGQYQISDVQTTALQHHLRLDLSAQHSGDQLWLLNTTL